MNNEKRKLSRISFAIAILTPVLGTYIGLTPPHPNTDSVVPSGDSLRSLNITSRYMPWLVVLPLFLLSLHTSFLGSVGPDPRPSLLLGHGRQNGINPRLFRWSTATSIPMFLVLGVGLPLRLVPYSALGENFTFNLAEPDRLVTTGIYRYVQHPSYIGVVAIMVGDILLFGRSDGVVTCWFRPRWYSVLRTLGVGGIPVVLSVAGVLLWMRVREEERMLGARFGEEWERWHATTARFVPGLF